MSEEAEAKAPEPVNLEAPVADDKAKEAPKADEAKEGDKPDTEAADRAKADEGDDEDKKKERLSGSERQKRKAQRLAQELAQRDAELAELRQRLQGDGQREAKPGIDREPTEQDFPSDYLAYERAKIAWDVRQAIRSENEARDSTRRNAQATESRMELVDEYAEAADVARERIPDFDQVVAKVNIKIPNELADEILSAGQKGPLISYYLAQNPDKLAQLVNMTGKELAREVGRIESRVHLPQAKKATDASPPPSTVKGGAAPAFDPFKSDDMAAYVKWRQGGGGTKASA